MGFNAKVTSKGQITLPADMRKALNLQTGDRITFTRGSDGRYYVVPETETLADLKGIIKSGKIAQADIASWIGEARGRRGGIISSARRRSD